jgi:hypothetical protein
MFMSNTFEQPHREDNDAIRNLRREPWSETSHFVTKYDLLVGAEWVAVTAHDIDHTTYVFPDGTRVMHHEGQITTLQSDGGMTIRRATGELEEYSAEDLDGSAAAIVEALRKARQKRQDDI